MFGSSPTPREFEPIPILKFVPGDRHRYIVLSDTVEGLYVHYTDRTYLCPHLDCPLCDFGRVPRYYAYLTVGREKRKYLLRLTDTPANELIAVHPRPGDVLDVECKAVRRPLIVKRYGQVALGPEHVVTRLDQLRTLWALFCLGSLPATRDVDELILLAAGSARAELANTTLIGQD
ncbi:hypothetical protein LCGC14_1984400 [marine sediment metagenome]|uniref:Uncharacterized protein n=1 Tax=marine sediment metagenome TaxID=412755 RepID=A0A0F9HL65_9ZZZZ